MTTVTESGGRQNMYPTEPRPYLDESYKGYGLNAEQINGRLAMIGLVTGFVSYYFTGNFFSSDYSDSNVRVSRRTTLSNKHTNNTQTVHYHDTRSRKI